ncbi:MAG TPA: hypothetical protein VMB49_05405 [Acidobacteriaceae bacterium]|nr:hypothetical protein [Acidobacteriaceae bacterium]
MAGSLKVLCVGSGAALKTRVAVLEQHQLQASGCAPEQLGETLESEFFDVVLLPSDIQRRLLMEIREKSTASAIVCLEDFTYPAELVELIRLAKRAHL